MMVIFHADHLKVKKLHVKLKQGPFMFPDDFIFLLASGYIHFFKSHKPVQWFNKNKMFSKKIS